MFTCRDVRSSAWLDGTQGKAFAIRSVFRAARFWVFFVLWLEHFSLKNLQAVFSPRSNEYSPGHS
jgi:hypothetical protein